MQRFDDLAAKFSEDFPGVPCEGGHLEASYDSAVAQFRNHLNSVGFLPVYTCPGATWGATGCGPLCYARHGRGQMTTTIERLARNTRVLVDHCQRGDVRGLTAEFLFLIDYAHRQYESRVARESRDPQSRLYRLLRKRGPIFRFHWAGDFLHKVHARAVREACRRRPQVQCWAYTRSFHLLSALRPLPDNLRLWLSKDGQNGQAVQQALKRLPEARIAHMGDGLEGVVCPKYRHLETRGACPRCGICFTGTLQEVVFPIKRYVTGEKANPLEVQKDVQRGVQKAA